MSVATYSASEERVAAMEPGLRRAARSGLDVMLSDAALEGGVSRFLKPGVAGRTIAGVRLAAGLDRVLALKLPYVRCRASRESALSS